MQIERPEYQNAPLIDKVNRRVTFSVMLNQSERFLGLLENELIEEFREAYTRAKVGTSILYSRMSEIEYLKRAVESLQVMKAPRLVDGIQLEIHTSTPTTYFFYPTFSRITQSSQGFEMGVDVENYSNRSPKICMWQNRNSLHGMGYLDRFALCDPYFSDYGSNEGFLVTTAYGRNPSDVPVAELFANTKNLFDIEAISSASLTRYTTPHQFQSLVT